MAKKIARLSAKSKTALKKIITVKNADGDPDTTATIVIQNKIKYTPKVSVIIPVYNVEQYLRECLDSVVNQTLREIEIICVDDGSTDSSLDILKEYAKRDNRITVIKQQNLHAGVARNAGLSVARGEYIHFLDSDDWIDVSAYSLVPFDNAADVYLLNYNSVDNISKELIFHKPYEFCNSAKCSFCEYKELFLQKPVVPWNKIYKRRFINVNNLKFDATVVANDRTFYFAMLFANPLLFPVSSDKGLINYRTNNINSLVGAKRLKHFSCHYVTFDRYKRLCIDRHPELIVCLIDLFIRDCKYFYDKADTNGKKIILNTWKSYVQSNRTFFESYEKKLKKYTWYNFYKTLYYKDIIPVVFATNDKYVKYIPVVIKSILTNSSPEYFYDIYIFHAGIKEISKDLFDSIKEQNFIYQFVDLTTKVNDLNFLYSRGRFSKEMWFRIFIPEILFKYSKAIYLDCDMIVTGDLSELWHKELKNTYLAACKNPVTQSYTRLKNLGVVPEKYFNSGMLVFNISAWNKYNIKKLCIDTLKKHPVLDCPDQDVLNIVCANHVHYLDMSWNFMWQFIILKDTDKMSAIDKKEYTIAQNCFKIIHYTSALKPWDNPQLPYANFWWKYAKQISHNDFKIDFIGKLNLWYTKNISCTLNLNNPKTFNEKIQWLKLFASTPDKTRLADKYLVRDWVSEKIGDEYLIPLLGVYDSFDEINFKKLPKQFVIKCNHGCGYNIIVKDKTTIDLDDIKNKLNKWMNENFAFRVGCELHYRDIPPKIIIEKYIENKKSNGGDLYDYKFWCFDGRVHYVQFLSERNTDGLKMAFYDRKWKKQKFVYSYPLDSKTIERPDNLDEMIELAEKLSAGFNHVRVDFYRMDDGKIYFGEMTFTSASGACKWNDEKINRYFGKLIKLPKLAYNIDTGEYYKLPKIKKQKKEKKPKKKLNIKPYLLFPYYLIAMVFMKYIKIPVLKFVKHTKQIWYSHSHRGKMDMLNKNFTKIMQSVTSVKNDMTNQITQIKNQQSNLEKQIADLKNVVTETRNTGENISDTVNK